jgi:hypothetical protein
MAEFRKAKIENHAKPRARAAATLAKSKPLVSKNEAEIKRMLGETQDQLSLIHGVLEELCERQEALAAWQMEFSKRLVTLQEAQWRSLEDLAGVDMGRPVEKAFGIQLDQVDPESMEDQFDEASKVVDDVNSHAMPKRAERIRRRRDPLRTGAQASVSDGTESAAELVDNDRSPESVFVMPTKVDVH